MSTKSIKNLVIVESPAKAKTIANYLGKDFKVLSSVGHIRSIAKDKAGKKAIDTTKDFATIYEIDSEKKKTVAELKKSVASAETVWLATDEDREGEAIAWHLCEVLKLDPTKTNRIVFHEITKDAIQNAIKNPRKIDMNLVKAQQTRQILDRLVGFELSPVVWRKVPGGKSAGRVQSPAVKLLVEREREIMDFAGSFTFKISGEFTKDSNSEIIKANLSKEFDDEKSATKFLAELNNANFTISNLTKTETTRNPLPPFTTSTLQQDANNRLGYSARTTMSIAQSLYQSGFITYMRTDSFNLSNQFLGATGNFIEKKFGKEYLKIRQFSTKSKGAQEAHEAIRPTDPARETINGDARAQKLYDLIRNRTLASQMSPAKIERTTANIAISSHKETFTAKGQVLLFDGFLKVYGANKEEILPALEINDILIAEEIIARQTFARPPARYTEGSLVKKLEELGIGRPSTYATIINTVQTRGYAEKGESDGAEREVVLLNRNKAGEVKREIVREKSGSTKGKLMPTASGTVLTDFLNEHFTDIDDYDFTARIENELDEIAENKLDKTKMLHNFYDPFHAKIDDSANIERSAVSGQRELGIDPKTGEPIFARIGRFGPMLQLGSSEDKDKKPRFATFPRNARLETITLEQALKMFELPRIVGTWKSLNGEKLANAAEDGEEIIANIGRFGPYVKVGSVFVSIKPNSPFEITEEQARQIYRDKLIADAAKNISDWGDIKVLNGRFGPYVTDGNKNAKIPAEFKNAPEKITESEARKILSEAPDKPKRKRATSKKRTKK